LIPCGFERFFDPKLLHKCQTQGYIFNKAKFPVAPVLLGIILEPIVESNFRRALTISHGSYDIFLRPICFVFLLISLFTFLFPIITTQYSKYKKRKTC